MEQKQLSVGASADLGYRMPAQGGYSAFGQLANKDKKKVELLISQYRSWVYICAYKNAVAIAENNPAKMYVTTKGSQRKARCPVIPCTSKFKHALKTAPELKGTFALPHVKAADDIEEVTDHQFLDLMRNPNSLPGGGFALWYLTSIYQDLTGKAYWWMPKDKLGVPAGIFVLPPQWVKEIRSKRDAADAGLNPDIVPDDDQATLKGVAYGKRAYHMVFLPADEIVQFIMPNPANPFDGYSPTMAIIQTSIRDKYMDDYEAALNRNSGRPDVVISPKGDKFLGEKERKALQADFNAQLTGVHNQGKVLVSTGQVDIEKMGFSPRDLQFHMGRPWSRDQIANAFGVPVSMLKSEGVPRANLESALFQYAKFTIQPRLTMYAQVLNERVIPMWDNPGNDTLSPVKISDRVFVAYDNVVPEDKEFALKKRDSDLENKVITINEARAEEGRESVPWGDRPVATVQEVPYGTMPVTEPTEPVKQITEKAGPEQHKATPQIQYKDHAGLTHYATSTWEITVDDKGNAQVLRCGCGCHGKAHEDDDVDMALNGGHNDDPLTKDEKEIRKVCNEQYDAIEKDAVSQAPAAAAAGTVPKVNTTKWAKAFTGDAAEPIGRITIKAGNTQLASQNIALDTVPWIQNQNIPKAVRDQSFKFLKSAGDTVQDRFQRSFAEGLENGENITELTTRLEDVFANTAKQGNAEMIARTESARAQTEGSIASMKEAGFTKQVWVESADACPFCRDAVAKYGNEQPIGKTYWKEGEVQEVEFGTNEDGSKHTIRLPHNYGDVIGPPLHPRCRGVMTFEE
jgi:HK97 family phage portal protein